ncbi:MAG: class II aldolase family protein [Mesoaciditoga sp.]|uniref:class II aldolase/adducin family protein n=3 Tax=Athalassotoga sp. TaxID=2022597 RepID=UPI000CB1B3EE|nr:MAG: class II aldolase family protein [Mesoaciditoga sp.]HEU24323.1 class II aldolase/adducin family protein [Mesoaciditoga lauensis]
MNIVEELVEYSKLAWDRGLTESTGGNMSVRLDANTIYITPHSSIKHFLKPKDIIKITLDDKIIEGDGEPSSERKMHFLIYKERPDINCVFHVHPTYATAFAVSNEKIPINTLPEAALLLKDIAYLPYRMPGTQEFADVFTPELKAGRDVFILQNHGVTVIGKNIKSVYEKLETLDFVAKVVLTLKMAGERIKEIDEKDVKKFLESLKL